MRVVTLALLVAALALPSAAAQLPVQPAACGPIDIPEAPAVPAAVAPGGTAQVTVDVTNGGQVPATVTVTGATTSAGWTIITSPEPATVEPGASGAFTFVVSAAGDAGGDATVSFAASGACETPQGLPCPGNACNAGSANTQVQVPLRPAEGFRLPALGFPIEYLLAAVVLVGLAAAIPFAMRKKRPGLHAECPEPLKMLRAGRGTSFPIEIRNGSKEPTTAHFEVGPVPQGWSAFMPLPEVQLAAREARSLWLMVRSPQEAQVGDTVDIELRLKDARRGGGGAVVRVRAEVQAGAEG